MRVPWRGRRSNQSILKEINPEYSLERHAGAEAPILWPSDAKSQLTGKDPDVGKDQGLEEKETTEYEMVGWHYSMDMSLSKLQQIVKDREAWRAAIHRVAKSWTRPSD